MKTVIAMVSLLALVACKEEPKHTLREVQKCMDDNSTSLVDLTTIRNRCAYELSATGMRNLEGWMRFDKSEVTIWVDNPTTNQVVTSISVNIRSRVDQPGSRTISMPATKYTPQRTITVPHNRFWIGDLWIEPGQAAFAKIPMSDLAEILPNLVAGVANGSMGNESYSWDYESYRFVEIRVK